MGQVWLTAILEPYPNLPLSLKTRAPRQAGGNARHHSKTGFPPRRHAHTPDVRSATSPCSPSARLLPDSALTLMLGPQPFLQVLDEGMDLARVAAVGQIGGVHIRVALLRRHAPRVAQAQHAPRVDILLHDPLRQ